MLLLAGLSTGHKIGLAVVAIVFILFALSASFLAPRRWPDFPGRNAMSVFVIASFVLFIAMVSAVIVFGKETEEAGAEVAPEGSPAHVTIRVTETDERMQLPALKELQQGTYIFVVKNAGTKPHDFSIQGPHPAGDEHTDEIAPGETARLQVALGHGNYGLYSSVDGDQENGLVAQISVG